MLLYFTSIPVWYGEKNRLVFVRYYGFRPPLPNDLIDNIAAVGGCSVKSYEKADKGFDEIEAFKCRAYFPLTKEYREYNLKFTLGDENENDLDNTQEFQELKTIKDPAEVINKMNEIYLKWMFTSSLF